MKKIFNCICNFIYIYLVSEKYKAILFKVKNYNQYSKRLVYIFKFPIKVNSIKAHSTPGTIETIISELFKIFNGKNINIKIANVGSGFDTINTYKFLTPEVLNFDILDGIDIIKTDLNTFENLNNLKFDLVILSEVIEHLDNPSRVLRILRGSLNDGGILIITTPNVESLSSRLTFMFKSTFDWFGVDHEYHIHPIFDFYLNTIAKYEKLSLITKKYNLNIIFGCNSNTLVKYLSETKIFVYKK